METEGLLYDYTMLLNSIEVLPRQEGIAHAVVDRYAVPWSSDGKNWTEPLECEFSNIRNNPVAQRIALSGAVTARHLKFTVLRVLEKNNVTMAEIRLFCPKSGKKMDEN